MTIDELLAALQGQLRSQTGSHALLLVELGDPFRLYESIGYRAAAELFERFYREISAILGPRGVPNRFGETSICIFLPRILNPGHAVLAAQRLRRAAEECFVDLAWAKPLLRMGIALYPRDASDAEALLRAAQLASAAARRRTAHVVVYDETCVEQVLQPARLGAAFGRALEDGKLAMHYQPKVRVRDATVAGVEALMRWLDGAQPISTPDLFLPCAEEAGLMNDVAWMSLTAALRTSVSLGGLPVGINITPGVLHQKEFLEMIETAIRTWSATPGILTLELTEGALVADFAEASARLTHVRKLGVRVSIDDFGTGYSSFSYFKRIPADEIKIDKSFVLRMVEDSADQRLVAAIIALAHQFDLKVVAEGVESRECLAVLARLKCDYAQGFLIAPAMDEERLRLWLRDSESAIAGLYALST